MSNTKTSTARLLRVGEAAEYLFGEANHVTTTRLTRAADKGQLRCVRIGDRGDRWFSTADLDRWLYGNESESQ